MPASLSEGGMLFISGFDSIGEFLFCTLQFLPLRGMPPFLFFSVINEVHMADLVNSFGS